ncbi:MAG TPA: hypothetical protein VE053_06890 [Allosphingosinicella sp.]|nr:hypothetical protein [Allosphingosinicella sp.]
MSGWTTGPWQVSGVRLSYAPRIGVDTRLLQVGPDDDILALVFFDMRTARGQSDAHLIAAAPDLAEALEIVLETPGFVRGRDKALAALLKAKGGQS